MVRATLCEQKRALPRFPNRLVYCVRAYPPVGSSAHQVVLQPSIVFLRNRCFMCSPTIVEGFSLWSSIITNITNRERRIGTHACNITQHVLILSKRVFKLRRKSFIETHKITRLGKALIQQRNPGLYRYGGSVSLILTGRRRWNVHNGT